MNCLLIEMGEMACYTERRQECGRIPPGRKALPGKKVKPPEMLKKLVGRKLSGKKPVTHNGSVNSESHPRTTNLVYQNSFTKPSQAGQNYSQAQQQPGVLAGKYSYKGGGGRRQLQQDSMV